MISFTLIKRKQLFAAQAIKSTQCYLSHTNSALSFANRYMNPYRKRKSHAVTSKANRANKIKRHQFTKSNFIPQIDYKQKQSAHRRTPSLRKPICYNIKMQKYTQKQTPCQVQCRHLHPTLKHRGITPKHSPSSTVNTLQIQQDRVGANGK